MERPTPVAGGDLLLRLPGSRYRVVAHLQDEGVECRVVAVDPGEQRLRILDRRELFAADEVARFGDGEPVEVGHGPVLRTSRSTCAGSSARPKSRGLSPFYPREKASSSSRSSRKHATSPSRPPPRPRTSPARTVATSVVRQ